MESTNVLQSRGMAPAVTFLTSAEAAERLGIDCSLVRAYCRQGRIKAERQGRDWLIQEQALVQFERTRRGRGRPRLARDGQAELRGLGERMADAYESGDQSFRELTTLVMLLGAGQTRSAAEVERLIRSALESKSQSSLHRMLTQEAAEMLRDQVRNEEPQFSGVRPADVGWPEFLRDLNEMAGAGLDDASDAAARLLSEALHDGGFDDLARALEIRR